MKQGVFPAEYSCGSLGSSSISRSYTHQLGPIGSGSVRKLDVNIARLILEAIESLASNLYPSGCVQPDNSEGAFRIGIGDWPVAYAIQNNDVVVLMLRVGRGRESVPMKGVEPLGSGKVH